MRARCRPPSRASDEVPVPTIETRSRPFAGFHMIETDGGVRPAAAAPSIPASATTSAGPARHHLDLVIVEAEVVRRLGVADAGFAGTQGKPFVGQAGKLLDKLLAEIGMARKQCFIANVLKCRPPGNRDPQPAEIEACEGHLSSRWS